MFHNYVCRPAYSKNLLGLSWSIFGLRHHVVFDRKDGRTDIRRATTTPNVANSGLALGGVVRMDGDHGLLFVYFRSSRLRIPFPLV